MRSLFFDIHRTVMNAVERAGYPMVRVLSILGISRSWYYARMDFSPFLDGRFNSFAARGTEWIVVGDLIQQNLEHFSSLLRSICFNLHFFFLPISFLHFQVAVPE
jgi:hypothetical protein